MSFLCTYGCFMRGEGLRGIKVKTEGILDLLLLACARIYCLRVQYNLKLMMLR